MFHPELTPKERISRLEGAYEQVDKRLGEFWKSVSELRYPHRVREKDVARRDVARMIDSLRAEMIARIDETNKRIDETNRRLDRLGAK